MPRQKPFNKKTATTYALVNRPQHDPLINDSDAPTQVFADITRPSKGERKNKILQRRDLDQEFGDPGLIRDNEGEAAEYGIYFDDSSYDYMQHLREIGGSSEATWVEAPQSQQKRKGKERQTLEDALREVSLVEEASALEGVSLEEPSSSLGPSKRPTYQDQQDVPDTLAGFQPGMDPRLREVLEALEDEEYVDDDDDIFGELTGDGSEEVGRDEWESSNFDDDDDWESDDTERPSKEFATAAQPSLDDLDDGMSGGAPLALSSQYPPTSSEDGDWLESFAKSKGASGPGIQNQTTTPEAMATSSDLASTSQLAQNSVFGGRKKKRKGALTASTGFSMSSSSIARTEAMSTLDSRFDRIANYYMDDIEEDDGDLDDGASLATMSTNRTNGSRISSFASNESSEAPKLMPTDFDSVMDDFLGGPGGKKVRLMKKGGDARLKQTQSGMDQLDEIRSGLGPAKIHRPRNGTQKV